MSRLDIETLQKLKAISKRQKAEDKEALSNYHYLARVHGLANTHDLKHQLSNYYPEMSAQIFYHFDDREIGGLIVRDYSTHQDGKLRELASVVREVLHLRSSSNDKLEKVLGMQVIPFREVKDKSEFYED